MRKLAGTISHVRNRAFCNPRGRCTDNHKTPGSLFSLEQQRNEVMRRMVDAEGIDLETLVEIVGLSLGEASNHGSGKAAVVDHDIQPAVGNLLNRFRQCCHRFRNRDIAVLQEDGNAGT
ncbi:MAG: hypothetical protein Q9184_006916 [Pyrenodesmia sp. 2 TL-2023]